MVYATIMTAAIHNAGKMRIHGLVQECENIKYVLSYRMAYRILIKIK